MNERLAQVVIPELDLRALDRRCLLLVLRRLPRETRSAPLALDLKLRLVVSASVVDNFGLQLRLLVFQFLYEVFAKINKHLFEEFFPSAAHLWILVFERSVDVERVLVVRLRGLLDDSCL